MDLTELKDILRILEEQDITEFELEHDGVKLRVCRGPAGTAVPTVSFQAPPPTPAWPPSNGVEAPVAAAATAVTPAAPPRKAKERLPGRTSRPTATGWSRAP